MRFRRFSTFLLAGVMTFTSLPLNTVTAFAATPESVEEVSSDISVMGESGSDTGIDTGTDLYLEPDSGIVTEPEEIGFIDESDMLIPEGDMDSDPDDDLRYIYSEDGSVQVVDEQYPYEEDGDILPMGTPEGQVTDYVQDLKFYIDDNRKLWLEFDYDVEKDFEYVVVLYRSDTENGTYSWYSKEGPCEVPNSTEVGAGKVKKNYSHEIRSAGYYYCVIKVVEPGTDSDEANDLSQGMFTEPSSKIVLASKIQELALENVSWDGTSVVSWDFANPALKAYCDHIYVSVSLDGGNGGYGTFLRQEEGQNGQLNDCYDFATDPYYGDLFSDGESHPDVVVNIEVYTGNVDYSNWSTIEYFGNAAPPSISDCVEDLKWEEGKNADSGYLYATFKLKKDISAGYQFFLGVFQKNQEFYRYCSFINTNDYEIDDTIRVPVCSLGYGSNDFIFKIGMFPNSGSYLDVVWSDEVSPVYSYKQRSESIPDLINYQFDFDTNTLTWDYPEDLGPSAYYSIQMSVSCGGPYKNLYVDDANTSVKLDEETLSFIGFDPNNTNKRLTVFVNLTSAMILKFNDGGYSHGFVNGDCANAYIEKSGLMYYTKPAAWGKSGMIITLKKKTGEDIDPQTDEEILKFTANPNAGVTLVKSAAKVISESGSGTYYLYVCKQGDEKNTNFTSSVFEYTKPSATLPAPESVWIDNYFESSTYPSLSMRLKVTDSPNIFRYEVEDYVNGSLYNFSYMGREESYYDGTTYINSPVNKTATNNIRVYATPYDLNQYNPSDYVETWWTKNMSFLGLVNSQYVSVNNETLYGSGNTLRLTSTYYPAGSMNFNYWKWTSSNPSVATVDGGLVTSVSPGTTVITLKTKDWGGNEKSASCTINVVGTCDITYNLNGGTNNELNPATYNVQETTTIYAPATDKTGYSFGGWYLDKACTAQNALATATEDGVTVWKLGADVTGDVTLYAKWIPKDDIKVTYNGNAGPDTVTITPTDSYRYVTFGSPYGDLPVAERTGCDFIGWFTESDGGIPVTAETIVTDHEDHTLYAHYEFQQYNVKFETHYNAEGIVVPAAEDIIGTPEPFKAYFRSKISKPADPSAPGFRFDGWYTSTRFAEEDAWKFDTWTVPAGNVTLLAKWVKTNRLNINLNGGSIYGMDNVSIDVDAGKTESIQELVKAASVNSDYPSGILLANNNTSDGVKPEKTKYEFVKWVDKDGNDVDITTVQVTADMTIYALWEIADGYRAEAPTWGVASDSQIKTPATETTPEVFYENAVIKLATPTTGAQIYYRTKNSDDRSWTLYTDGIKISDIPVADRLAGPDDDTFKVNIYAYASKYSGGESPTSTITLNVFKDSADWGDVIPADRKSDWSDATDVTTGLWVAGINPAGYPYKGSAYTYDDLAAQGLHVYYGRKLLTYGTDYTATLKNNTNVYALQSTDAGYSVSKEPTLTVTCKGNYAGSISELFKITPIRLVTATVANSDIYAKEVLKNGLAQIQTPANTLTCYIGGKYVTLKAGKDYTISYPDAAINGDFAKAGVYTAIAEAVENSNFTGSKAFNVHIEELDKVLMSSLTYTIGNVVYDVYDHTPAVPTVSVKNGRTQLADTDYVHVDNAEAVSFTGENADKLFAYYLTKNTYIGNGEVTFVGNTDKGYAGTVTKTFKINGTTLTASNVTFTLGEGEDAADYVLSKVPFENYEYDGTIRPQQKAGTLTYNKGKDTVKPLVEGTDYELAYDPAPMIDAGTYTVKYTGINGFTGSLSKKYSITAYNIDDSQKDEAARRISVELSPATYVKGGAKPEVTVTFRNGNDTTVTLEEGKDYTLAYKNNTKVYTDSTFNEKNAPFVTITGKGNFAGKRNVNFTIAKSTDVSSLTLKAADKVYANKKGNFTTSVVITDADGKNLAAGTDYNKPADFKYYYVEATDLADGTVRGADEEVDASDIVPAGTLLKVSAELGGKGGNYSGTISGTFRVVGQDISKASIKVNQQYFTGSAICPDKSQIVVVLSGRALADQDYEIVSYENNINKGNAKLTIRGVGEYGGTKTGTFAIAVKPTGYTISFNANRATSGTMKNMTLVEGREYKLNANAYKRAGFNFIGWNTYADGNGIPFDDNEKPVTVAGIKDMTDNGLLILYAQWDPEVYHIRYHLNGGANNPLNLDDEYTAESDNITIYAPLREDWPVGYQFGGWYKDSDYKTRISVIRTGSIGDMDLYAKWIPYTYTVEFEPNLPAGVEYQAKTNGTMPTETFSYGIAKALIKNKYKLNGYVFLGWSEDETADSAAYQDAQVVLNLTDVCNSFNEKVTLYAVWSNRFSIDYDLDGGYITENETDFYDYGVGIDARQMPKAEKDGYTLAGWYKDPNYKSKVSNISKSVSGDMILYAKWTPWSYKIVYNSNDPKPADNIKVSGSMKTQSAKYGTALKLNDNTFTLMNYRFGEWNTQKDGSGETYQNGDVIDILPTVNNETVTLYAMWDPVSSYTASFVTFGGTLDKLVVTDGTVYDPANEEYIASKDFTVAPGSTVNLSSTNANKIRVFDPVLPGYVFGGWYKDTQYKSKVTSVPANTDMTLYAKWTPMSYKIAYDANVPATAPAGTKAAGKVGTQNAKYDSEVILNANAFAISGYKFTGWSTVKNGAVKYDDCAAITNELVPDKNNATVTLYAQWEETDEYTVSFETNGGTLEDSERITDCVVTLDTTAGEGKNDTLILVDANKQYLAEFVPEKGGAEFVGWYKEPTFKTKVNEVTYSAFKGDVRLYAKWKGLPYTIHFDANAPEGTEAVGKMSDQSMTYGTEKALSKNAFAVRGYEFMGWSLDPRGDVKYENNEKVSGIEDYDQVENLYAQWKLITYGINYFNVVADNTGNPHTYTIEEVRNNAIELEEPYMIGNTFLGWYSDAKMTKRVTSIAKESVGDLNLYAKWAVTQYTINYDFNLTAKEAPDRAFLDTSKAGYITSYDAAFDNGYLLPTAIDPDDDYEFAGWYKEAACRTEVGPIVSSPNIDMTVYAKWVRKP